MPFILRPSRNRTLQLAWELLRAQERKDKKAAKAEEPPKPPPKKQARKPAKKGAR